MIIDTKKELKKIEARNRKLKKSKPKKHLHVKTHNLPNDVHDLYKWLCKMEGKKGYTSITLQMSCLNRIVKKYRKAINRNKVLEEENEDFRNKLSRKTILRKKNV